MTSFLAHVDKLHLITWSDHRTCADTVQDSGQTRGSTTH